MRRISVIGIALLASMSLLQGGGQSSVGVRSDPPDVVLIVTDDQRWDTMFAMPSVRRLLGNRGVTFENAFVVNALCCPSRTTILTGQYSHGTGVYTNSSGALGGFAAFDDSNTVATWLRAAGYRTALIGKYLNGYWASNTYVPPGWDRFVVPSGNVRYFDYQLAINGRRLKHHGSGRRDYSTHVLGRHALRFVQSTPLDTPLFLMFNPVAPHGTGGGPPQPAPGDAGTFDGIQPWRPPNYNERLMGDKPAHAQGWALWDRTKRRQGDHSRQRQLESLLEVDRAVASLVDALRRRGTLNDALIIFTSDNGFGWGEHRWRGKEVPYEESIRVPLIIRHDPLTSGKVDKEHLVLNLDLAPTIADIAGLPAPGAHGQSVRPILEGRASEWRSDFLIEHVASKTPVPTYCAVRSETEVVIRYDTDEWEYYDLDRDPWQLRSRLPPAELRDRLRELCEPRPLGMG